jgi:K+-transporting ATPase ATPase C chain
MLAQIRPALVCLFLLTLLTGVLYPLAVTGVAKLALRKKAEGSLIVDKNGQVIGSSLIGQPFSDPKYFWGRLSATTATSDLVTIADPAHPPSLPYNAENSLGSNLGPRNPDLGKNAQARIDALKEADPDAVGPVPVDLVTSSASGLDPDISPAAATYQVHRIAKVRAGGDPARATELEAKVKELVASRVRGPDLGVLGEARVNVLELNLALDAL